ncbi:MAG: methyltransferase domain-containing protein [Alphaproteobacteria bacterium]
MALDVIDLRDFYAGTVGRTVRRLIQQRLRDLWPNVKGETVLGLGFATPYLRPFIGEAARTFAIMPASQGVLRWPAEGANLAALAEEDSLPLFDFSVDRVILIHAIETTEWLRPMLREVWRVLSESGKLIIVVPNRRGVWSRIETTPFGSGQPYTAGQLSRLLRETMFVPGKIGGALFLPPTSAGLYYRAAPPFRNNGRRSFRLFQVLW